LLQQNLPVLHWGRQLTQAVLYNFHKTVVLAAACTVCGVYLLSGSEVNDRQILDEALAILSEKPVSSADIL